MKDYVLIIGAVLFLLSVVLEVVVWIYRGITEGKWLF